VKKPFTVARLLELLRDTLQLELIGDASGLEREITTNEVSSPGLVLAGFVDRFPSNRLQVFGETEITYLASRSAEERRRVLELFFSFDVPCVVVTKGQELPHEMVEIAGRRGIPLLRSALKTTEFYRRVKPALDEEFAPSTTLHGSLADVYGVGLLFVGRSGIGKSECVLDLVERGHRLVADDLVIATRRGNDIIIGRGHELQRHHMEIRGVGVIDIPSIFGIRAVRQQKRIEVVVQLEEWNRAETVDRTGLDGATTTILDVEIPRVTIPLNPGKNITVVAEVIAMNHLLRYSGIDPAHAFNQRLLNRLRAAAEVRQYLAEDDE
jgi:HPr kinase/phosphorylase